MAKDVADFLDHPLTKAAAAPSLYALEASHPEVIAMLAARVPPVHEPAPTQPETAANPIGWQDRAEQELADTDPAPVPSENISTAPSTPAAKKEPST